MPFVLFEGCFGVSSVVSMVLFFEMGFRRFRVLGFRLGIRRSSRFGVQGVWGVRVLGLSTWR